MALLLFYVFSFLAITAALTIPSYVKLCKKTDQTTLNLCFTEAVQDMRSHLLKGIPEMELPSINPLAVPLIKLDTSNTKTFKGDLEFRDAIFEGVEEYTMLPSVADLQKGHFVFKSKVPFMKIKGTYHIKGELMNSAIDRTGPFQVNMTEPIIDFQVDGNRVKKNGKEHFLFDKSKLTVTYKDFNPQFQGMFDDQKRMDTMNKIFKEKDGKPVMEKTLLAVILPGTNNIFSQFSIDELFP